MACLGTSVIVSAQQASEEDELAAVFGGQPTVSIATGSQQPLRRAPAVATVIGAADIAAIGEVELDRLLESVPGLHVSRSNQGYGPLYLIRGIASEFNPQTLMLLNGVPVTTLFVGNRGNVWGGLTADRIARIEVIRGPGSALYGADAYSGVINIVTKTAADVDGTELGARIGALGLRDGWLQHGGQIGSAQLAAFLRVGRRDGPHGTVERDAQTALDELFGTRASLAPGPTQLGYRAVDGGLDLAWQGWRLRADYKLRDDLQTGAGVAAALDPVGRLRSQRHLLDLSRNDIGLGGDWTLGLRASYMHYEQTLPVPLQLFPPGAFNGAFPNGMIGAPETWERQLRLGAVLQQQGAGAHRWRIGIGHDDLDLYRTREFKNFVLVPSGPLIGLPMPDADGQVHEAAPVDTFLAPHRRRVDYLYVQDEWHLRPDWTLTAGVRHDRYSDVGGTTNPRVALVWDARLDLTAKLLYGRAFRAPAFTEQFSVTNPVVRGNPALRPETIQTLEAALAWQATGDLQLHASLFGFATRDGIRIEGAADGSAMFTNIGRQRGRGLELEAQWQASRHLRLSGNLALQRTTDQDTGQDAGYAPHRHLWARADWAAAGGWLASAQLNQVAGRRRAPGDARAPIADYTTLDLTLRSARTRSGWEFSASVLNLFDADAREPSLAPGTSLPNDLPLAR
ncbi:TonB-dependent receptor plug domain-containing protein, partial [Aquabacterium sp.]|uniref:TonB-dependent receptor plug domain-containing protein n=1 Tax=Aquabacterium sp. TaxID=1872578 RepID=UPI0037845A50